MFIISDYKISYNKELDIIEVVSYETCFCPNCSGDLKYFDSCVRFGKIEGGEQRKYSIHRYQCLYCDSIHRELIDKFIPYKQYESEVISGVLDEVISSEDIDTEDYPCESTILGWKEWYEINRLRIDGYMKSIGYIILGFPESILDTKVSILETLRKYCSNWLEKVVKYIYNSGGFLVVLNYVHICGFKAATETKQP